VGDHRCLAADHKAVAALQAPHATTRPHVHVVDPLRRELLRAPDVVPVVGVASVDENIAGLQGGYKARDCLIHGRCRNHQPDGPWFLQFGHEVRERERANGALLGQLLYFVGRPVEYHALMATL
jgi:hypothetical protein